MSVGNSERPRRASPQRARYHHGDLRRALIAATLELAHESSPESVSVREAARRVGVSSGAPFRHFASRTALLTAVAEEAMQIFIAEIDHGQRTSAPDVRSRLMALGSSFIRWALRNPTHFRIISTRQLIDFDDSPSLARDHAAMRVLTAGLISEALGVPANDPRATELALTARALVYGLARMAIDGQLPQWDIDPHKSEAATISALERFIDLLAPASDAGRPPPHAL